MAARVRNDSWKNDANLREDLTKYVRQQLKRMEILSFVKRDYEEYAWSERTLDRRLSYFGISYSDTTVTVEEVQEAVREELNGPGQLLGYRAMHKKVRQEYLLNVPRALVHDVLFDLDPEGLEARQPNKRCKRRGHFTTKGTNWVHSADGHDKLMGYMNSTFPLAVYGCIDTASRKLLWLKIWTTNSDPKVVGRWYLDHLYETRVIAAKLRVDKGTETTIMSTMHAFLRQHHDDMDPSETVIYGPSTSNQIERWWRELHERLEKYFKMHLRWLKDQGHYNPQNENHRMFLAFLLIPILQKELDSFRQMWNTHRIREQNDTFLPAGVPDHIYNFPGEYGMEECGLPVTEEQLEEVAQQSGVLDNREDFLEQAFRDACEQIIQNPSEIQANEFVEAYMFMKDSLPDSLPDSSN